VPALTVLGGLVLSALVVAVLAYGLARWAGASRQAEMRSLYAALPVYPEARLLRTEEHWENLLVYWQSEGVLPRVDGYFHAEQSVGAVLQFYKERLTAAGWQEYREPWSLFPAYRRGNYHLAILFQTSYAQDWLPAGDYQVHLWSPPLLEGLLGRDLAGAAGAVP